MAREFWDARFAGDDYLFGAGPNQFVVERCGELPVGAVLDLGCGEGRNAVWLATRGHAVTGVDVSPVALAKAQRLAAASGVEVAWVEADVTLYEPERHAFDLVLLSYVHLPDDGRRLLHRHAVTALAPGGRLVLVGHHVRNLDEGVGGPQDPAMLYDETQLAMDFASLDIQELATIHRPVPASGRDALDIVLVASPPA